MCFHVRQFRYWNGKDAAGCKTDNGKMEWNGVLTFRFSSAIDLCGKTFAREKSQCRLKKKKNMERRD